MKVAKITLFGLIITCSAVLISCKDSSSKTAAKDKSWTQEQRKEYMENCMSSAKSSYEQRGQVPDREAISKICICTGKAIEAKYGYDESSTIPEEEMKNFVIEATKKCASE